MLLGTGESATITELARGEGIAPSYLTTEVFRGTP
jgi:hypothetical protein